MFLYALKDVKAMTFGGILVAVSDGHVGRVIQERFSGSGETVEKFPEDYELYKLGSYSVDTGSIVPDVVFVTNVGMILQPRV